ncbi:hypothetical protein CKO23_21490 [Thiocystis violacea]|nr:hypothetical protein [Thiocystis violacea]
MRTLNRRLTLAALCLAATQAATEPLSSLDASVVRAGAAPATVEVWNRPIVTLRAVIGPLDPAQRAEQVQGRIEALPPEDFGDAVHAEPAQVGRLRGWLILVRDDIIVGILPEDLDPESGRTVEETARDGVERLREVFQARAEQQRLPLLLRGIGFALGATLVYALLLLAVVRIKARVEQRLRSSAQRSRWRIFGVQIRPLLGAIERYAIKFAALAIALMGGYLWLTFVLVQFPYTEPWGTGLGAYLSDLLADLATGIVEGIPGVLTVLIVFFLTRLLVSSIDAFFKAVEEGRLQPSWIETGTIDATRRLTVAVIWIFALTVAYPYIPGSDTAAFKGVSVFVGLMISLGSAGFINQIMSGLVIVYARAFGVGDYVRLGKTEGLVSHVGLLSTKVVTRQQEEVTLPNAVVVGHRLTNFSRRAESKGAVARAKLSIGYDTPWRQVHALLNLAASRTPGIRKEPRPVVLQLALADFYVEYELQVRLERVEDRIRNLSDLNAQILDVFNEYGVQIMSPHFNRQPEQAVVVENGHWHTPPAADPADGEGHP